MNKLTVKNAIIIINIAVSLSCIFVIILDKIQVYLHINDYGFLWFLYLSYTGLIIYLYCAAGFILFIRFLIKNKITVSKKYLFLIPSVICSIFIAYSAITFKDRLPYLEYSIFPAILLGIGAPTLLAYYLSGNYKLYLSAILCFTFPCNAFIIGIMVYGWIR